MSTLVEHSSTSTALDAGTARWERTGSNLCLFILGRWTLPHYKKLESALTFDTPPDALDFSGLTQLDTAGASLLCNAVGAEHMQSLLPSANGLSSELAGLLQTVAQATQTVSTPEKRKASWLDGIERVGELVHNGWRNFVLLAGFMGLTLSTLGNVVIRPSRWRITALVTQLQQTGLNAVPIVALLTFLVGAVIAFLGATVLANFGASIYTVNLVAYSFLREFGVLLTAILLAGRTASAFTAQLGSMKVNEEIDALRTLGLNPMELLVIPRVLALLITLPLLTFVAMICGIAGGAVVGLFSLDISLAHYISIVHEVPARHFVVGILKAPIFAFMIALIGCLEGFKVKGSASSVGEHTTSSVVQSIFVVILLDAIAAIFCMEMDW